VITLRILVVDDDPEVRESLQRSLEFEGYRVDTAADGAQAVDRFTGPPAGRPDLVIMDLMMPGVDGLEACRTLRATGERVPVLMLTARDGLGDRITGFDAGADDYLMKPFALEELLARLRALARRARPAPRSPAGPGRTLRFGGLELNLATREAARDGQPLTLTPTEFQLLAQLMSEPRRVQSRAHLQQEIWGHEPATNSLDVYVGYLRRKLEADGRTRLIHTARGVGYVLREPA
jgi:two-component system response regulator MprA